MPVIKVHVEAEELAAIDRRAKELGVTVQDFAYGALSCSMGHIREAGCRAQIEEALRDKGKDLPLWSDSARSVSIYESMPDIHGEPGPKGDPL
jgi:hypothetical protein